MRSTAIRLAEIYQGNTPYEGLSHVVSLPPSAPVSRFHRFRGLRIIYEGETNPTIENSRRATYVQRQYSIDLTLTGWVGYDSLCWITCLDGPTRKYNFARQEIPGICGRGTQPDRISNYFETTRTIRSYGRCRPYRFAPRSLLATAGCRCWKDTAAQNLWKNDDL